MNEIVKYNTDNGGVVLSSDTVTRYLVSGGGHVSEQEVKMFIELCKYRKLNPFLREAYLIKYSDTEPATIVVGKDVMEKRAAGNIKYDGIRGGVIVKTGGNIVERNGEAAFPGDELIGGWAEGYRKDWKIPAKITVSLAEYIGKKKDGTVNRQWLRMPGTMIVKVAKAHCRREMFPAELSDLYEQAEMALPEQIELPQKPLVPVNAEVIEEPKPNPVVTAEPETQSPKPANSTATILTPIGDVSRMTEGNIFNASGFVTDILFKPTKTKKDFTFYTIQDQNGENINIGKWGKPSEEIVIDDCIICHEVEIKLYGDTLYYTAKKITKKEAGIPL